MFPLPRLDRPRDLPFRVPIRYDVRHARKPETPPGIRTDFSTIRNPGLQRAESLGESLGIHSGDEADCMFGMHMVEP